MSLLRNRKIRRRREHLIDSEHEARMEKADRDLQSLRQRAEVALDTLESRDRRNHWQESISAMIRGAS